MKKWKWYQYMSIVICMLGLWNIVAGIVGERGVLVGVGIAIIIGAAQLFNSKDKKKKVGNGGNNA